MKTLGRTLILFLLALAGSPVPAIADGLIIIDRPIFRPIPGHFSFAPLEVTFHRVNVEINDLVAVTTVDQEFFNPGDGRLEGTYIFPLPKGAHIDKFALDVNGKMMEAELLPADKARALYEEIVRKAKDPGLLEYVGQDAFKVRIFPIEPHSRKPVKITYTQLLKSDSGLIEYLYPLNTEKFSSAPLKEVSVKVSVNGKQPLKSIYSPSHTVEIKRDGQHKAVVGYEETNVRPDSDFKVIFSRDQDPVGIDLLTYRKSGEDGYFLLLASPGWVASKKSVQPKDITFVLDTSGSMSGGKLEQAKKALRFCLSNLNKEDRFEVIRFSTDTENLFGSLTLATEANVSRADGFVQSLKPIGGTAIFDALGKALALRNAESRESARPYLVIFLTDGLPTVGETGEDPIVAQVNKTAGGTRVFSFGIGTDVNTHLLDRIAKETKAISQYVLPKEDIEVKVSSFYTKIKDPVFSNLSLKFSNAGIRVKEMYPTGLPDLFNGDMLTVFGRYSGSGASAAQISGVFSSEKREFVSDVSFAETSSENEFIPRLWATRRVGWLLDEIRIHGETAELKDEVTRLAREFGIVTPYTAYLVLEDEARRDVPIPLRSFQDLEKDKSVYGESKRMMDSMGYEAATPSARSGSGAVQNSKALADLQLGENLARQAKQESLRKSGAPAVGAGGKIGYREAQSQNYALQVRVVNGRSFYQNGPVWTDSTAQAKRNLKQKKIQFGGDEYFALLKSHPNAAQWLALGDSIDLVIGDTLYHIRND